MYLPERKIGSGAFATAYRCRNGVALKVYEEGKGEGHDAGFRAALENDKYFVAQVEGAISDERDFDGFDYFGYKTLEKSYLLRHRGGVHGNGIAERPQHLLMRVALGIHRGM